ncbi:phage tail protein [Pseudomonas sp. 910_23]|uniref:tail fiber assembly protein n=1 Tax=Pseudomonas sp. 910_23 TaxID=2604461 RepID=UPI0040645F9F
MSKLFSKSTMGLYDSELTTSLPNDAVEISSELFLRLIEGPSQGLQLSVDTDGLPCLVEVKPSHEEVSVLERKWRDAAMDQTDWLVARHRDERDIGGMTTLEDQQFSQLLAYRQELRLWPDTADFPDIQKRPKSPLWLVDLNPIQQ